MQDSERVRHEQGLAQENAMRRAARLPELTLEQYIAAGYRYDEQPTSTARTSARTGPALDPAGIYAKLNAPQLPPATIASASNPTASSEPPPAIDTTAAGADFFEQVYLLANHGHVRAAADERA